MTNFIDYIEVAKPSENGSSEESQMLVRKSAITRIYPYSLNEATYTLHGINPSGTVICIGEYHYYAKESYDEIKKALLYPDKKDQNLEKLYAEAYMACKKYNRNNK